MINFPDYNIFSNVNIAYVDLVEKIWSVVNKIASFIDLRMKNNTSDWFDDEVAEAIKLKEKHLRNFKSTKSHSDEESYKESKYLAMKLMKEKKKKFYKEKLKENTGKPKELWKALKSLGFPCKKASISNVCLEKDDKTNFDDKTIANNLKQFFWNLAGDLVVKLPPRSNEFRINSVCNYYQSILDLLPNKFNFSNVTEDFVLKLLKDMNIDKAAGIDSLSGRFLKMEQIS